MESSSFSGSSKRAKAHGHITQVANCLVDGCNADLSLCRDYHRRHKVCEVHSKTSKVTIGGREQRFCQQCSRFHSLVEFDEGKRSCRKRLDGHNRRRRKPQSVSFPRNAGILFSSQPGTRLLSFGSPQMLPSSVISSSSWSSIVKPENNISLYNNNQQQLNYMESQNAFTESSANGYHKTINQLQFMQGLGPTDSAATRPTNSAKLFFDGLNQVVDSDRALSLLSSAPHTATREFGLNHAAVQPEPLPHGVPDLHYSPYSFGTQESKTNISSHGSETTGTLHYPKVFHHHGNEGSSSSGSHQTLTFNMWE